MYSLAHADLAEGFRAFAVRASPHPRHRMPSCFLHGSRAVFGVHGYKWPRACSTGVSGPVTSIIPRGNTRSIPWWNGALVLPGIARCFPANGGFGELRHASSGWDPCAPLGRAAPELPIRRVVMLSPPNQVARWWTGWSSGGSGRFMVPRVATSNGCDGDSTAPGTRFRARDHRRHLFLGPDYLLEESQGGRTIGEVSPKHMKLEGMKDYVEIPATHTFITRDKESIRQTIFRFLRNGKFTTR